MGRFSETLDGLAVGANATFIDSEVSLPADLAAKFEALGVPMPSRDMTNAPDYLYNLFLTYDLHGGKTQFGAFYSVQGDTLLTGAGTDEANFIPNVYQKAYGTLNLSFSRVLSEHFRLQFQAKNLTNPDIEEVYRSEFINGGDEPKSSYSKGREFSISLSARM